jgi:DHA1 family bicyclomycin/chloramphenicol resistance-like MFS transporter
VASFICVYAKNLEIMIFGRILQGIALSAPRTIAIAMVRDIYSGDYMARVMSFITVVFLLVPIVAPALGKFILMHYGWQAIFYVQIVFGLIISIWFWRRQAETLIKVNRVKLSSHIFVNGIKELMKYKTTIGFTIISGFITASFLVYLSASQQIFVLQFNLENEFPFIFAGLAISVGIATFLNGTLVLRFGMKKLVSLALYAYFGISIVYVFLYFGAANPGVITLLSFFGLQFFAIGFLFGNLRALAMQPIGHIAGIGAAITGFISTLMAVPISTFIGRYVVDTALPLFIGFSICGFLSILILLYLNKYKAS